MRPLLQDLGLLLVLLKDPAEDFQNGVPVPLVQQLPADEDRLQTQLDAGLQTAIRRRGQRKAGCSSSSPPKPGMVGQVDHSRGRKCNTVNAFRVCSWWAWQQSRTVHQTVKVDTGHSMTGEGAAGMLTVWAAAGI